jgi:hypothetical protein
VPLFRAFKWDALDNARRAVGTYTCYPSFSVQDILRGLSNVFDGDEYRMPFEIAAGVLGAASRVTPGSFLYLEASEDGNPRKSFDINMYRAGLQMWELYPSLSQMFQHYSIPSEEFHGLYEQVKGKVFGHLTGGIDREGRDFFSVYFGQEGR